MSDADYYREQASFCAHMASTVPSDQDKERWLRLAEQWRDLEKHATGGHRPSRPMEPEANS